MANAGAIGGGALGGAGTGAMIGTSFGPVGTAVGAIGGAIIGGLSGLFSSQGEEDNRKKQMLMRAADQRAAPYLAKAGVRQELTPYAMGKSHSGDVLEGALNGFSAYQNGQKAGQENELRDLMKQKLSGNDPTKAMQQNQALGALAGNGSGQINEEALMQYIMKMQGGAAGGASA